MENLKFIEEALRLSGIHDNMILPNTINISGEFIPENDVFGNDVLEKINRIKITINFEAQLDKMITTNL